MTCDLLPESQATPATGTLNLWRPLKYTLGVARDNPKIQAGKGPRLSEQKEAWIGGLEDHARGS